MSILYRGKIILSTFRFYSIRIWLALCLVSLCLIAAQRSLQPGSPSLVWKPYLQQVTDTGVIVLWVTQGGASPELQYSRDTSFSTAISGTTRSLDSLGVSLHRVELTGLEANTGYNYKIFNDGLEMLPGETLSFQTAPATGSYDPFTFIVFGDYGMNSSSQRRLRDQMLGDSFQFILTTGDNAYSNGDYPEFDSKVFQIYQDIFGRAGVFPTLGNHDYGTAGGAPYLDIFELPGNSWRSSHQERYYSFDYGNVHVIALDSNSPLDATDSAADDDMFDWLRADLSQTHQLWKIVAFHHAAYSTGHAHGSDSRVQMKLIPIFEQHGVDLVFNGHDHIYQRSKPIRNGQITTVEQGGIIYTVSGAGAAADRTCGSASWVVASQCSKSYGLYSRVMVSGTQLTLEAVDENGNVLDTLTLNKNPVVPLTEVALSGPAVGFSGSDYTFTAATSPLTATQPFTYTWQAEGQLPITSTTGLVDQVTFSWDTPGTRVISVTAANAWASVTETHTITVGSSPPASVYLPVILSPGPDTPIQPD